MTPEGTRRLVDPELLPMLELWPALSFDDDGLAAMRDLERMPVPPIEHPERVEMSVRTVPGLAGAPDVALTLYRPAGQSGALPCIYHVHGGGYVIGRVAMMEPMHRGLVEQLGCALVAVEYRAAPETPYPGPLDDCVAGLDWLFANAAAIGIDATRIGLLGESAGGGLAAGLALRMRDEGVYRLAFQHLVYPMLDDRTCTTADPHPNAGEFVWTPQANAFGWGAYLGREPGGADVPAHAAAARATDLAGLPPTFLSTGALDLFVEEDLDYARRLIRAGVPTELHVYPGAFHGFDIFPGAAVSRQAVQDRLDALRRALA